MKPERPKSRLLAAIRRRNASPPAPKSPVELARERLRERLWEPTEAFWPRLRSFAKDYWADLKGLSGMPLMFGLIAISGVSGLAVWNDKNRWMWIALALLTVVVMQIVVAYRRQAPGSRFAVSKTLEDMIREGMGLVPRIKDPKQEWSNISKQADPDEGRSDAQLATDFVARAMTVLPAGYSYDVMATLPNAVEEYHRSLNELSAQEQEAARRENREPGNIYVWPWPTYVHSALKVLSTAHKDLTIGRG